jgi:predicted phosphoribosyltransferase
MVIATPFASIQAVDRMHVLADDLYCLNVIEDYMDTDHYYDKRDVPDHETVLATIEQIVLKWK